MFDGHWCRLVGTRLVPVFLLQEDTASLHSQAEDMEKLLEEQRERQAALVRAIDEQTEKLYAGFQTYISQVEFLRYGSWMEREERFLERRAHLLASFSFCSLCGK